MNKTTNIDELRKKFEDKNVIELKDIDAFYREKEPSIPKTTVNWRVYALVQGGMLQRVGKGLYRFGKTELFVPEITHRIKSVSQLINKQFPFINYCQWELSYVNHFSQHLINFNILFVDVEKDALDSVYYALKEQHSKVMLISNLYGDLSDFNNTIFVRPLISDSPVQKVKNCYVATLEKMLVDIATDKGLIFFQGNEVYTIIDNASEKYTINQNTMLRYAGRKNKRGEIEAILKTINRQ
ncbi:MAG: hypothetical protein LBI82_04760 [Dysgonamonadaceae bacterium]|jgi:hypothetical protein|nr:hypothetical protein [Dysgonamonadaceae bacterium]